MKREFTLGSGDQVIRVRTKMWLEIDGQRLIGEGRAQILRRIQEAGSINAAAIQMNISYRKAWSMVKDMEDVLKQPLVDKTRGGLKGGTTKLTPVAIELLEQYESIQLKFQE